MAAAIAFASFLSLAVVALVMRMAYLTEERNGRALADTAKRAIAQADTRALLRRAGVAGSTAR